MVVGRLTVGGVLERMGEIERGLESGDGVAAFTRVYRRVTEFVVEDLAAGRFADGAFVERLDVVFAELFFANVDRVAEGREAGRAWRPLFESRADARVWPFQHVLAGMNAHINHDLALAVIETCVERGVEPDAAVHADFLRINATLERAEAEVRAGVEPWFAKLPGEEAEAVKHLLGSFSVARARDLAWQTVEMLWPQRDLPHLYARSAGLIAQVVGFAGRLLVAPALASVPRAHTTAPELPPPTTRHLRLSPG